MTGSEIRERFLAFFEEKGHRRVASSSLVPEGDPTLMFTNAGMVQFKRVFLGEKTREYRRATTAQKCMRVSGKHNDLENVGRTTRHHTFFEMLGNFSFGDYFKREAIAYAWELLVDRYGLPADRLQVSVHESDDEAFRIWREEIGLAPARIHRLGDAENFWQMGDTGPCGPCSEIHWVRGEPCGPACGPACGCGRFTELWNLVFMQYEQTAAGERKPLPKPSIDTGMGLERLAVVLQGVESNYDTDLFQPLLRRASELAGVRYGADPERDVSLRVVADHARACAFLVGDGVLPSNEGRGYVLRRVLRRAARHGVLLGLEEPFLWDVAAVLIDQMGAAYPELVERRAFIEETVRREEERFGRTLRRGLELLEDEIAAARRERRARLSGDVVFKLYDTFGFPIDLTEDILVGQGLGYDRTTFEANMREQSERARAAWKGSGQTAPAEAYGAIASRVRSEFTGYESLEDSGSVVALLREGVSVDRVGEGERVEVVVDRTPFYAESGGQVGDTGAIEGPEGRVAVEDTRRPVDGVIVHAGTVSLGALAVGDRVALRVDPEKRRATVRNHSGTHLLHWALREVLGPQVRQAGSLVAPDRLRFDFTHDGPLTPDEVSRIEDLVNERILENAPARVELRPYAEALREGAIAIFEEKYGDEVRVVRFGDFSTELCGGTHAAATGDIGSLRIVSQSAVGAGVRRIEAQTGMGVLEHARREARALHDAADLLRVPPDALPERIRALLARERELERELERTRAELRRGGGGDPLPQAEEIGGVRVVVAEVEDANPKELRAMIDETKQRIGSGVVLLATRGKGKAAVGCGVTKDLTSRFHAGELVREVASVLGGSGGGRPDFAQAGGPEVSELPRALDRFRELVRSAAGS